MKSNKPQITQPPSYDDDFEPLCNWIRKEDCDTLVVHLPEFKKEQLNIQVTTNSRVLKISGERALNASKRSRRCKEVEVYASKQSRFSKEVPISDKCNVFDTHANFVEGLLYVEMPKKIRAAPARNPPPPQPVQADQNPNGKTSPDDNITIQPTSTKESILPSENAAAIGKTATTRVSTRRFCS